MKVGIVAPYYHPHPGGVEVYASNIAKRLSKLGWEVFVITTGDKMAETSRTVEDGVVVYRLGYRFKISNTPIGFGWRREMKRIITREKPDVINGHTPVPYFADIAKQACGAMPFVLTYHNDLVKERFTQTIIAKLAHFFLTAGALRRADRIIATSAYYIDRSVALRRHKHKITIVPPGVDTSLFNPQVDSTEVRQAYNNKHLILFVGSIEKTQAYKGLDYLIKSFAAVKATVPNAQLVIVGAGNGRQQYEQLARKLGIFGDVTFAGYKTQAELAGYSAAASVQVLPSTTNTEGFGMVLIEAGACGTPVIGTKVGGIPFAIDEGVSGLLVPPRDTQALANAIVTVLTDPDLAKRLGQGGAERSKTLFDWDTLARQTAQALAIAIKPTIVQVAGYYPPHLGGMEKVAQVLAEDFARRGYNTQVLTSNIPASTPAALPQNLTIQRYKSVEFAHTPFAPGFIGGMMRIPKRSIVHLHLAQAFYPEWVWLVCKLRRIPYVLHFHLDLMPSGPLGWLFLVYKAIVLRGVIRGARKVIVFSAEQQRLIHERYGVAVRDIAIIPNGVGAEYIVPPRMYAPGTRQLLFVGRLAPQKRVDRLIDAMAKLKMPAHLTLVGDGEDRTRLEAQARRYGLSNVTFVGSKNAAETREYYKKADALVVSSDREGMSLVTLEALASALPIVASRAPGLSELLENVGVLVDNPSGETFAAALNALCAQPKDLAYYSRQSCQAAKGYTWQKVTAMVEGLYREVAT